MFPLRTAVLLMALAASAACAQGPDDAPVAVAGEAKPEQKPGYWFYKKPPDPPQEKKDGEPENKILGQPPSEAELLAMHPKQFEKLLEDYRQYALWKMEPQHVSWYYQLQDFARRRSRAFMNVTEVVMLQNPSLNMQTEYPANAPGQSVRVAARQTAVEQRLAQERGKAALIFLQRPECGFCEAQRTTLRYFTQKHGWEVREVNVSERPEIATRFGTNYTPTVIVIFRGTDQWMPVAVGVESVPRLEEGVYRALRMISGETTPQQFTTLDFEDGGLLDPQRR